MNQENQKLKWFGKIYDNLRETEKLYIELEEFGVDYNFSEYFDANVRLSKEIEETIDFHQLTPAKQEKYKSIMQGIYSRLNYDYPSLYSIGDNIESIFYKAYEAAEQAIEEKLEIGRFYACGISSFKAYLPEYTLLGIMWQDGLFNPENFTYSGNVIRIDTLELNKKYSLTGQEYELYESAYLACLQVLRNELKLEGHVEAEIR